MASGIPQIPLFRLAVAFLPVVVVVAILFRWRVGGWTAVYAVGRMVLQLLLVGYALLVVFATDGFVVVACVLAAMLAVASWIALRPLAGRRRGLYTKVLGAIAIGGGLTLVLITQAVLVLDPWFSPRYVVPLAGMIFANAMNAVSLAAERFAAESEVGLAYLEARTIAMRAALIPLMNSLFAVGLVSIPGMMTGLIIADKSPVLAVRYQVMVMCMVFGASGISAALFLAWMRPATSDESDAAI